MKVTKIAIAGLLCMGLLNGCVTTDDTNSEGSIPPRTEEETTASDQTYRQVILQLQQQLETLQAEQMQQSEDYEKKIDALEAMIAELESANQNLTQNGNTQDTPSVESLYTYRSTEGGVVITSYLGKDSLVEIPSSIDGIAVVGIGEGAFRNSSVEQVVIPVGVKTIDWFAFYGSYRLRSVILPASVNSIEYGAFELCSSALKFTCPSGSYAAQYAVSYGIPVIASSS